MRATDREEFEGTGRFELRRRLGAGGFGVVYEAVDRERGTRVALKVLRASQSDALYDFKQEFRALADIVHPNLVSLYELLSEGGRWFFTMELVKGRSFLDWVWEQPRPERDPAAPTQSMGVAPTAGVTPTGGPGPVTPSRSAFSALPFVAGRLRSGVGQLAAGITALHAAGKLHRDIKPSNVLVTEEGRVVVLDFGLVADLEMDPGQETTAIVGTPAYMSPEQGEGVAVTEASDWYAVGVMLYEALAGRLPFDAKSVGALFIKIAAGEYLPLRVYRPDAPDELAAIVDKAMHRDRDQRYQSMEALRSALVPYAPGDTRIRAKTISDSPKPARATQAYEDVPRPPRTPKLDTMSMGVSKGEGGVGAVSEETVAADSEPPADEPRMPSIPAAAAAHDYLGTTPDPAPRVSRGTWVAAATIVGVAAAVAIGLAVSGGADEPVAPESVARTPEAVAGRHAREAREARADEERARSESEAAEPTEERAERQPAAEAAVPDEGVEAVAPSPERRVRPLERRVRPLERRAGETPAERAGLDPNPYGN